MDSTHSGDLVPVAANQVEKQFVSLPDPLVSILIPCCNAERWVGDAIQSALDQTYAHKEVIVVDDGSTDRSVDVIKSFGDRIRWETWPNRGANAARNRLLELSQGEWLQYLDADDYLLPTKIEVQMKAVSQTACDLVVSPCDSDIGVISAPGTGDPWVDLMGWRLGNTISNLWRKEALIAAGGWDPSCRRGQDYDMMFRLLRNGARVAYCPQALAFNRVVNPASVSRSDPVLWARMRAALTCEAAEFALRSGVLSSGLGEKAGKDLFRTAERLWAAGSPCWREYERLAHRADPTLKTWLRSGAPVYGRLCSAFGICIAQRYLRVSKMVKRVLAKLGIA